MDFNPCALNEWTKRNYLKYCVRITCTRKMLETGVSKWNNFLAIIYDKLITFISEKIQYCFNYNIIQAHISFIFIFLKSPNLTRIMTFRQKSEKFLKKAYWIIIRSQNWLTANLNLINNSSFFKGVVWDERTNHRHKTFV